VSPEAGTIDESLRPFTARERLIAVVLAAEGKAVQAIPESLIPGERSADAWVEGHPVEFQSLAPGATSGTVRNVINASMKRGGQARDIIVDARGSGLSQPEAVRALARIQGITRGRLDRIRLLGDGYELSHTYA